MRAEKVGVRFLRIVGVGIAGLLGVAGVIAFVAFVLLVEIGGISYRKDCLTSQGTVSQSWTFQWAAPIPFVFRPSEKGCIVHTGAHVALNAIGIDTFTPSTPEAILGQATAAANVNPYWPALNLTVRTLQNTPTSADLTTHIAALSTAQDDLVKLSPPAAYSAAHQQLTSTLTGLVAEGHKLQQALMHGNRRAVALISSRVRNLSAQVRPELVELNRIHSAQ